MNIIDNFRLEDHLRECEIIVEEFEEFDGEATEIFYKELTLTDQLKLSLYESGQATLEYRGHEIETFMWDSEITGMIENFYLISAVELFDAVYRKRWRSILDESN